MKLPILPKNHVIVVVSNVLAVLLLPPAITSSGTSFSLMAMWPHTVGWLCHCSSVSFAALRRAGTEKKKKEKDQTFFISVTHILAGYS